MRSTLLLIVIAATAKADYNVHLNSPPYFLPPMKAVVVTKAGEPGPGADKHKALASLGLKDDALLPDAGPFDVWFVPKDGKPIKAMANWKAKEGANGLKIHDHLGVINFKGDGQPRGTLLVTPHGDDGPETKKHTVIQTASDTRADLAVPPGDYAIWVVPSSGARARRVVDRVRVLAGKSVSE